MNEKYKRKRKQEKAKIKDIERIVQELTTSGGVTLRAFRSCDELTAQMQSILDSGKAAICVPDRASMGRFYNVSGFNHVMSGVLAQIGAHRVVIEPNFYGSQLVMAVAPAEITGAQGVATA